MRQQLYPSIAVDEPLALEAGPAALPTGLPATPAKVPAVAEFQRLTITQDHLTPPGKLHTARARSVSSEFSLCFLEFP